MLRVTRSLLTVIEHMKSKDLISLAFSLVTFSQFFSPFL
uniref:Uncharacterized protein n=1 Tax=Brassica oleracea TaxID=3712 RepID=A0A3P6CUD1_BRAOL|nr:unnamed protein product [Brassica oleracea]